MPITYNASELLKCTVNFNFSRYLVEARPNIPPIQLFDGTVQESGVVNTGGNTIGLINLSYDADGNPTFDASS